MTGLSDNKTVTIPAGVSESMLVVSTGQTVAGATDSLPEVIVLEDGASLDITVLMLADTDSFRLESEVELKGDGASFHIGGAVVATGDARCNIKINVKHKTGGCTSRQEFRTIATDMAKVLFDGKITVDQDSQKTEAYQENHNLLLSDKATVTTLPQLEIYADDVKCSHGATVGRLNEDELFYMRSRGISENEARHLQMQAFIIPSISLLDEYRREEVAALIDERLSTIPVKNSY